MLFIDAVPGLGMVPIPQVPAGLPSGRNYFEVTRDPAAWPGVVATNTLAIRFRDALVRNRHELQGQRKLVIQYKENQAELEFALFAIPSMQ